MVYKGSNCWISCTEIETGQKERMVLPRMIWLKQFLKIHLKLTFHNFWPINLASLVVNCSISNWFKKVKKSEKKWLRKKCNWFIKEAIVEFLAHKLRRDKRNLWFFQGWFDNNGFSKFILQLMIHNFRPLNLVFLVVNCSILIWLLSPTQDQ